jgi:hypothetical protein
LVSDALARRHKNIAMVWFRPKMEPNVAKFVISVLFVGFAFGFGAGYAVRAIVSYYRRVSAERSRNIIWHDSHIRDVR